MTLYENPHPPVQWGMQNELKIIEAILGNVQKVIRGKDSKIAMLLGVWMGRGHILLEDVPGTGKTVLAKALAKTVNLDFGRIQFTPDLLPSDIIGTTIYEKQSERFLFQKGPIFSTLFLGDEINRATPRTQSALLECMAERQVTVENKTTPLDPLSMVIATQNPVEHHGTFPLPEAQLDRFSIKMSMGYPDRNAELDIVKSRINGDPLETISPVVEGKHLTALQAYVPKVKVSDKVYQYVLDIVEATRAEPLLALGASPRATMTLIRLGQAVSLLNGKDYVRPSYIFDLAHPVLEHRLLPTQEARFEGHEVRGILRKLLSHIKTPTE